MVKANALDGSLRAQRRFTNLPNYKEESLEAVIRGGSDGARGSYQQRNESPGGELCSLRDSPH